MAGDSVIVIFNGSAFDGWKSVEVTREFDQVTGEGTLVISEQPGIPLPANIGDECQIIMAGEPKLTGHVKKVSGSHGFDDHDITLTLRDKTEDYRTSTVGPKVEFKPPVKLKDVLSGTLSKMGLSSIGVIDKADPRAFQQGGELPVAAVDIRGHAWGDQWAAKRQVVQNTDGKGNLVIDRNKKERIAGYLLKSRDADNPLNNVLSSEYETDDFERHNTTAVAGQKSTSDPYWETQAKSVAAGQAGAISKNWGVSRDTAVRSERRRHIRGHKGLEGQSPEEAAKWHANLAAARSYTYAATVQGFLTDAGAPWNPGKIVPVKDDHWQISDELFIKSVTWKKDRTSGATSSISCTHKDSFTDQGPPSSQDRTAKSGIGAAAGGTYPSDHHPDNA